jgi:hypothetical protein
VLAARSRPGHCSQCLRWLGIPLDENCAAEAIQADELKWPIWVVETVGDLVAAAPRLSELPSRAKIAEAINACVNQMAGGNAASFSHELQMWESQTWRLQHGHGPVTIDLLLKICHHAGVSLVRLLTEGAEAIQSREINPRMFDNVPAQPEKSRRRHDYDSLRSALECVLASDEDPPLSMLQVCQCLDVDPANIRQRLPGLCQAISARYLTYQKAKRLQEHRQICNEVRQATRSIHLLGMYPTSTRVRALLSDPGYLRRRDAMATWRETLLELGWKR